jgi:hypothetical protein
MNNDKPELLTTGQTARRLRVPVKWLKDEAKAGKIPHLQAGKAILFNPDVVGKLLIERASKGGGNE